MGSNAADVLKIAGSLPERDAVRAGGFSRRDFFDESVERLRPLLRPELAGFRPKTNPMLLKLDFGNERVHYEVAPDGGRGQLEVGLHFEDGPVSTAAYLAWFGRHIVELKHELGAEVELERWTASWGRVYELHPLGRLDAAAAARTAGRLAAFIGALQPLVDAAAVAPERSSLSGEQRGPWRAWRQGRG